jgi:PAS domain S-box-containing protein
VPSICGTARSIRLDVVEEDQERKLVEEVGQPGRWSPHKKSACSYECLQALVEHALDAIGLLDADGIVTYVSPAVRRLLGYGPDDLVGREAPGLVHPQDAQAVRDFRSKVAQEPGASLTVRSRLRHRDGSWRWFELHATNLLHHPQVARIVFNARDITETERAAQRLKDREHTLRILLDANPEAIFLMDREGIILDANQALAQAMGASLGELVGSCIYAWLPPEVAGRRKAYADQVAQNGQPVRFEDVDRGMYIESYICPVAYAEGHVAALAVLTRDLTEQRHTARALQDSEERFRRMAEVIPAAFWLLSPDWSQFLYMSPACEAIYGWPPASFYANSGIMLDVIHPDDRPMVDAFWAEHHGQAVELEYRIIRADGEVRHIRVVTSPVRDDAGELALLTGFAEDITERREREAQVSQSAKLASLGLMASGIAHQLRNPLAIISTWAQLADDHPEDGAIRGQATERILAATDRASRIIENLLRFARPAGVEMVEVDVYQVIDEVLVLVGQHLKLHQVQLRKRLERHLPHVTGNADLLQQVFTNIILNACSAMPSGGTLTVRAATTRSGDVQIRFRDTGQGIAPENLPKLFVPFFSTKAAGEGTGLGLALSHSIIHLHRGAITVDSEVGKGAVFMITLPSRRLE